MINVFNESVKKNSKLHLVIAGPYEKNYIQTLKNLIKKSVKNSVTWTGPLYNKYKWDLYNCCHLFCLPSHQENFGISVAEAMSSQKPVLITNKVNIYKNIKKYNAGYVSDDNLKGITSSFNKVLKLNNSAYKKMCNNSFKCFRENFNSKYSSQNLINFLKKQLKL